MDTKSKNNSIKYIISTIAFLLILILSVGMCYTYPFIRDNAKQHEYNSFEQDEFLSILKQSNYSIYFDTLKNDENNNLKPSDILLDPDVIEDKEKEYGYDVAEDTDISKEFDMNIYTYKDDLDLNLKNLNYYAINKENNLVKERNEGEINSLLADDNDISNIEDLKDKYSFYIVIDYNENGDITVKNIHGSDKYIAVDRIKNAEIDMPYDLQINPIKNMTYVYAVQKELKYHDTISSLQNHSRIQSYNEVSSGIIISALIIIGVLGLIIPYKLSKEIVGFKKFAKIPIEIIMFIFFFTIGVVINEMSYSLIRSTLDGDLISLATLTVSESTIRTLESIVNIIFWGVTFGIVFMTVVLIKHIFAKGIIKYLKENSLTYKILVSIFRVCKRIYNYIIDIDLRSEENKKLRMLLGINLIILCIISVFWFFGIILAIIYTVVLYKLITKNYNDVRNKYNKLFDATNEIAEGNLDVNIEEDLGLFNSFKEELQNIQKGFKKAVNEEVKSQRMKTELITNVSHDLKTPLTSIITYVDLLKDENLPVDKRMEYLDTLDRKSQRLKDLIEDLFEVSKATSGNISLNIVDVDMVSLMKQTLLELDDKILKSSLVVKTNYPEESVVLPLDSQRMYRVFENLILNITKYALEGSRVYIDIINRSDKVEVILKNMAANEINFSVDEIMERFVRGDKSRNTEGSGLGLAIAKSFVELQGGKLDIVVDGDLFKVVIVFDK